MVFETKCVLRKFLILNWDARRKPDAWKNEKLEPVVNMIKCEKKCYRFPDLHVILKGLCQGFLASEPKDIFFCRGKPKNNGATLLTIAISVHWNCYEDGNGCKLKILGWTQSSCFTTRLQKSYIIARVFVCFFFLFRLYLSIWRSKIIFVNGLRCLETLKEFGPKSMKSPWYNLFLNLDELKL